MNPAATTPPASRAADARRDVERNSRAAARVVAAPAFYPPLTFGSVCSGIEAASVKRCSRCGAVKSAAEFHSQGARGLHSWCKECFNANSRANRDRRVAPERRRAQNIKKRYGLTAACVEALLEAQKGGCGICKKPLARFHIDHDHHTGKVRGLLCHRCNVAIGGLDDRDFRKAALAWLERGE